jgi:deazaflavin-dependent oxidoreductase (nitroreductase family)
MTAVTDRKNRKNAKLDRARLEQRFFRRLNAVVEPALRRGIGSYEITPAGLLLLETEGFKSGQTRSTPLLSLACGPYRIVSTVRGERSFWVKNLIKNPHVNYYLGGKPRAAQAYVFLDGERVTEQPCQTPVLRILSDIARRRAVNGWAVAILAPVTP